MSGVVKSVCVSMWTDEPRIKQPAFRLTPHVRAALLEHCILLELKTGTKLYCEPKNLGQIS